MSIERSFRASFQIVNLSVGAGGSGVAVWRDTGNNYLYIATAYHVVEGMSSGLFIDYTGKKYTNFNFIILDKTYDFALIELRDVPSIIQPVPIAQRDSPIVTSGQDVYVIGWPLLMDNNSVSSGTIRSHKWNTNGIMNQILISAPIFGGNSGGGVFLKQTNQLIGVVSWGLVNDETINGIVPHTVILEALYYFIYRPILTTPSPISGESYIFGINGFLIDPFLMQYNIRPTLPELSQFGRIGTVVLSILPNSPASTAGFVNLTNINRVFSYDIIWGIRRLGGNYVYINEENSLDSILYSFYVNTNNSRRQLLPRRSKGEPANAPLNIILPNNLVIECLVSRVVNNVHNNTFINRQVTLVKRDIYYNLNGGDSSSFNNEFMFGIRNKISKQFQEKEITPDEYGTKCLDIIHKSSL